MTKSIIPPKGVKQANTVEGLERFDRDEKNGEPGQSESKMKAMSQFLI